MEDYIRARIKHETTPHHAASLQKSIDSRFITSIESSSRPSFNYMQALKQTYKEELDRSLFTFNQKKIKEKQFDRSFKENKNTLEINYCLQDNFQEKKHNEIDRFAIENYDAGNSFFRSQDAYKKHRQRQISEAKVIMQLQMHQKENNKIKQKEEQNNFRSSMIQQKYISYFDEKRKHQEKQKEAKKLRDQMVIQIEDKRNKLIQEQIKNRQSPKKCLQKHNPILNPIEYHIENPYLLQKMQTYDVYHHS